ncbi:MAG: hypothetical protein QOK37_2757 [Thermoanaerobaculia bacterium]|jgi:hypothetical protein|nr:hypothetical protein [Thermoanaerobaculia bacterium]
MPRGSDQLDQRSPVDSCAPRRKEVNPFPVKSLRNALLVFFVTVCARAAILITPEQAVGAPVPAPQGGIQYPNAVASDGEGFLVFWSNGAGVNVAHVGADGQRLSSRLAVPVVTFNSIAKGISVSWTGSVYLASWDADEGESQRAVFAACFSRGGEMLSGPVRIASGATKSGALASNGRRSLLFYHGGGSVNAALFDAAGVLIQRGVPIPASSVPVVAIDGNEFGLVWTTSELVPLILEGQTFHEYKYDFHFLRVSDGGTVLAPQVELGRTDLVLDGLGIASGNGLYAIATIERHLVKIGEEHPRLVRFVVDPHAGSGTRLPLIDESGGKPGTFASASVMFTGGQFVAYLMKYSSASSFLVDTVPFGGAAEDVAAQPATVFQGAVLTSSTIGFASNGRNTFGVFTQYSSIYGALFDVTASTLADTEGARILSVGWSRQVDPAIAVSGTDSLAIWISNEGTGAPFRLLGARLDASGALIDRTPFEIAPSVANDPPSVVFTGKVYLVAWTEVGASANVVVRSVGRDAALGPRVTLGAGGGTAAASNGTLTLVVFRNAGGTGIAGHRFDALGQEIDTSPLVIAAGGEYQPPPLKVASNGNDFLVAWNKGNDYWQWGAPDMIDVYSKRVSATGVVDAVALSIATGPADQILSDVASNGRDYLVAYQLLTSTSNSVIAAKRVLREGQLAGATATDAGTIMTPYSSYSGVSLSENGAGGYWLAYQQSAANSVIQQFDQDGAPLPFTQSTLPLWFSVALATAPNGTLRIAYDRWVTGGAFPGTSLVFVRSSETGPLRFRAVRR